MSADPDTSNASPGNDHRGTAWGLSVLGVFVLYVLSPGPVIAFYNRHPSILTSTRVLDIYITPLLWGLQVCPKPLQDAYCSYLDLWGVK